MKVTEKAFFVGLISFIVFLGVSLWLTGMMSAMLPGDEYLIIFVQLALLASVVISCTYILVKKINLLLEKKEE